MCQQRGHVRSIRNDRVWGVVAEMSRIMENQMANDMKTADMLLSKAVRASVL